MARAKIGTRILAVQGGRFILWDSEVKGFFARRQSEAGKITFGFRYTDASGCKRELKLGVAGALAVDEARQAAKVQAGAVAKREDPAAERDAQRNAKTLAEAWSEYERLAMTKCKPRVQVNFRSLWKNYLYPHLGQKRLDQIGKRDVETLHLAITVAAPMHAIARFLRGPVGYRKGARGTSRRGGRTAANHAVELLSIVWNDAEAPNNPCRAVKRHKSDGKDVRFSDTELGFIIAAIEDTPLREQIAFGLFLECANRHQTVASAEWEEMIDLDPRLINAAPHWLVFGHKWKGGRPQVNYLSRVLADQILKLKAETYAASPRYLFPFGEGKRNGAAVSAFDPTRHRATLGSAWDRLRARALALAAARRVTDLRGLKLGTIHTFKHTYLSRFADLGASAIEVKQAGDHTDIRTSMRYIKASGERMAMLQGQAAERLPRRRAA